MHNAFIYQGYNLRAALWLAQSAKAARDQQLADIVQAAGERSPANGGQITRVDLREAAVVQNPTGQQGLPDLVE